ncbi:MAG: LLM class flavin-dependent oxidoreductase [Rhodospirillales bacterium]|nr:LLM class flavin-dependent oxidoreductase [Rhodospirillales bacterium]
MKFGCFANIQDPTKSRDYSELVDEMRELAEFLDEAGFDMIWIPEHHFSVWGRELIGNPLLMAADLAARTKRIRIGLGAAIVTFWHPIRLAEDVALLDHLTGGRLEVGVGRGNYGLEAQNLNPLADPNNQAMNLKVFAESVDVLREALANDLFSYKGEIYQFPAPGFRADRAHSVDDPAYVDPATGELIKLTTFPRPKQRPFPPMWQMNSEAIEGVKAAAAKDMGIVMWRPSVKTMRMRLEVYKETYESTHGRKIALGAKTAIMRDTYVAENEAEARRIAELPCMASLDFANWRGPRIYLDPGEQIAPDLEASLKKKLTYDFVSPRSLLFGSADDVVEKLWHMHQEINIEQVLFKCSWPGLPHKQTMRCFERIAADVIPQFRARLAKQAKPRAPVYASGTSPA